jgi:hypothetical protein
MWFCSNKTSFSKTHRSPDLANRLKLTEPQNRQSFLETHLLRVYISDIANSMKLIYSLLWPYNLSSLSFPF